MCRSPRGILYDQLQVDLSDEVVLFLGAGASLPKPAGGPLFVEVRNACAKRAGVDPTKWHTGSGTKRRDPRFSLLDNVIREVFLKVLTDAGYELPPALARAVSGTSGSGPNDVHKLAAQHLAAGGTVWTTNWDTWVERAYEEKTKTKLEPAVYPYHEPPDTGPRYLKLHGSASRPDSLLFATPQVMRPLNERWHSVLVESCRDRLLFVVGYAGADVDLYDALAEGVRVARAAYWFEGTGNQEFERSPAAQEELWRFRLEARHDDPRSLPPSGRHLIWCGAGSTASSPSMALLEAFGVRGDVSSIPGPRERFEAVDLEVREVERSNLALGRQLLLSAIVNERLGQRRNAALRHLGVVVVGSAREKGKSARSLGNLVLLRNHRFRTVANRIYQSVSRDTIRRQFASLQAGGVDHDCDRASKIAAEPESVDVDDALNVAVSGRWSGNLDVSERIARAQLERALAKDLSSRERDWPERVSRACFEIAQSLIWQGRFEDADDICRSAYMRISGAKWTAWELAMRAVVRFVHGDYRTANEQLSVAYDILHMEGFDDFALTFLTGRAACNRMMGELVQAERYLSEAASHPRKSTGSLAAITAERAELANASGDEDVARESWTVLTRSSLPLWKGIGHLRLAERDQDNRSNAQKALQAFEAIGSRWGPIRTNALLNGTSVEELRTLTLALGPVEVFTPNGPWLF